jgi:hypothetical protein
MGNHGVHGLELGLSAGVVRWIGGEGGGLSFSAPATLGGSNSSPKPPDICRHNPEVNRYICGAKKGYYTPLIAPFPFGPFSPF